MGTHQTDFREYLLGQLPADWSRLWHTATPSPFQTDAYARVRAMPAEPATQNTLWIRGGFAGRLACIWSAPSSDTGYATQEILVRLAVQAVPPGKLVGVRLGGTSGSETGYLFGHKTGTTWAIWRVSAGATLTELATGTFRDPQALAHYWIRMGATGSTIRARIWEEGDVWPGSGGPEPTSWLISTTDATYSSGGVGVVADSSSLGSYVHFVGVGTNGDTAPGEAALPRPLEQWALDPEAQIDVLVSIESAARSDGTVAWSHFTRQGYVSDVADSPSATACHGIVEALQVPGFSLAADALFSGAMANAASLSVRLRNAPLEQGGAGLLDGWQDRTFAGRQVVVRAGERGGPLRSYEPVFAGTMAAEPKLSPGDAVLEATTVGAGVLADTLKHRAFVGIPTALDLLTDTAKVGVTHADYTTQTFTVCVRFQGAMPGSSNGYLARRVASGSDIQYQLSFFDSSHATFPGKVRLTHTEGGTTRNWSASSKRCDDGQWHWVAFALRPSAQGWCMVDGEVIATRNIASNNDTASGAETVFGLTAGGLTICDARFYSAYLEPDEVRALMATRAEPDDRCIGMWRCDDGTGGTVTDYSAAAHNATAAGTDGVDRSWVPSDLGAEGLAGEPMPIRSNGQLFNVPAVQIDPVRFRYRTSDDLSGGFDEETVRARGYVLTDTTDYASSGDVIDMVGAQDEPVTVDYDPLTFPTLEATDVATSARELLGRHGLDEQRFSRDAFDALSTLIPWQGGWHWQQPPTLTEMLDTMVGRCGASLQTDRSGRIAPTYLLPPLNPGPYGYGPLLEFFGQQYLLGSSGVYLHNAAAASTSSFSMAFWFYLHAPSAPLWGDDYENPLAHAQTMSSGVPTAGWFVGFDSNKLFFEVVGVSTPRVEAPAGYFKPGVWYYLVVVRDHGGQKLRILAAEKGASALTQVAQATSITGTATAPVGPLVIGGGSGRGFAGAIAHVQVYNAAKVEADFAADLSAAPDSSRSGLITYVPLTDGRGAIASEEKHPGGSGNRDLDGRIIGARWCPTVTYDLEAVTRPVLAHHRDLRPAWTLDVRYRANHRPLTGAEIAAGVPQANRPELMAPSRGVPAIRDERATYVASRRVNPATPPVRPLPEVGSAASFWSGRPPSGPPTDKEPKPGLPGHGAPPPPRRGSLFVDPSDRQHVTPLSQEDEARRLADMLLSRFAPGRATAELQQLRRELLLLHPTDEVHLYHPRYGLSGGRAYRVIELSRLTLLELSATLGLWG